MRYSPNGSRRKVKCPLSSVLNSRRVWEASLTSVPEDGRARPVESLTERRTSPVSTCARISPGTTNSRPIHQCDLTNILDTSLRLTEGDNRSSMTRTFDAIVIGTGQSGPFLATRLAKSGMRVAVAERQKFGGTCVNTGCIPTKTLVASARVAYAAQRASEYGVVLSAPASVDMKKVKERKDGIVRQSNEGVEKGRRGEAN